MKHGMLQSYAMCLLFLCLSACAQAPKKGDLEQAVTVREELTAMITRGTLDLKAERVALNIEALPEWNVQSLFIEPHVYEGSFLPGNVTLKDSRVLFAIHCEYNMNTAIWYTLYNPAKQVLARENYRVKSNGASCFELRRGKIEITIGIYDFKDVLALQVPASGREARLGQALTRFTVSSFHQTDDLISEIKGMLIGESAGYIYHDVPFIIPHSTFFEKTDNNYYRLVLIGDRTLVAMDVKGSRSATIKELQAAALPIIKAMRFEKLASPN